MEWRTRAAYLVATFVTVLTLIIGLSAMAHQNPWNNRTLSKIPFDTVVF
jgi:hypothetical protein